MKNPACPDRFLRYLKNARNSFKASLFNNAVLLRGTLNRRSTKETNLGSSSQLRQMIFVGIDRQVQRFLGGLQNDLQGVAHVGLYFFLDSAKSKPGQTITRIMKQAAKMMRMFDFCIVPYSDDGGSFLKSFDSN